MIPGIFCQSYVYLFKYFHLIFFELVSSNNHFISWISFWYCILKSYPQTYEFIVFHFPLLSIYPFWVNYCKIYKVCLKLLVLSHTIPDCALRLLLAVFMGPYEMLGNEPRFTVGQVDVYPLYSLSGLFVCLWTTPGNTAYKTMS